MRKVIYTLSFGALILFAPSIAKAQLKGLIRNKAIEALTSKEKQEKEEEQAVEQQPEQTEQTQPVRPKKKEPNFLERKMMQAAGLNNVAYDQNYNFTSSMVMDIVTIDSLKNKDNMQYTTLFSPDDKSFALIFEKVNPETGKQEKGTMIFDMKNYAMLILSEENGERSGMAMAMPRDSAEVQNEAVDVAASEVSEEYPEDFVNPMYVPTGKSKSIAGYKCNEYVYKNEEGAINLWITKDNKLNLSKAYGQMQGFQALATGGWGYGMGTVMEMMFNDNSGASTQMLVKDFLPNSPRNLNISGYQIIGVGAQE
jgi:hypothetical protein